MRSLVEGAGSYSVAHRAGLLPTGLTGMWGWILPRSPHQGRGSPPAPAPTKQRPGQCAWMMQESRSVSSHRTLHIVPGTPISMSMLWPRVAMERLEGAPFPALKQPGLHAPGALDGRTEGGGSGVFQHTSLKRTATKDRGGNSVNFLFEPPSGLISEP